MERANMDAVKGDMTVGSVGRKLVAFAIPIAITNLIQALYNMADMSIVGHFVGSAGMSAVTMGGLVVNVVLAVVTGFSNGGSVYIGQLFGAGRKDKIQTVIGTMLTSFAILAVVMTGILIAVTGPMLRGLKTPDESLSMAVSYLTIYLAGTIFVFIFNIQAAALRAIGKSTPAMVAVGVTAAINILLDYVFVGPLKTGVSGAAAATVISQFLSVMIIGLYIKKEGLFDFKIRSFAIDREELKVLIRIGLPTAMQFGLTSVSFLFISGFVNQYGVCASAASGATSKIWMFEIISGQSVQMALLTLTAQNIAKKNYARIRQGLIIGIIIGVVCSGLFWAAGQFFPSQMLSVFTSDRNVIDIGIRYFQIFMISGVVECVMFCFYGVISGSGHTFFTFICAVISAIVVRITFVWVFDAFTDLGFNGIAWAYVCAPCASLMAAAGYYFSGRWKKSRIKL